MAQRQRVGFQIQRLGVRIPLGSLFVLKIVDMALIGNLVLMIIFAGYENFVSRIDVARQSPDKPSWMGHVDFTDLKLKLVASIVAISGINLLEAFMSIGYVDDLGVSIVSDREIRWMIICLLYTSDAADE